MKNAKKFRTLFLAAVAAITVISLNAFKSETRMTQWYEVTPHPTDENLDQIGEPIGDPTLGGTCDAEPLAPRCAIELTLEQGQPKPETVGQARVQGLDGDSTYQFE